jgi:hypothetical protein
MAIIVIPSKSSELFQLISSKSVYARRSYKSVDKIDYILLTGSVSHTACQNFLDELFHSDHGS